MSRPDPAPRRGGEGDPLSRLRSKGMKKAPSRSVIEEMGTPAEPAAATPTLHAVPSSKEEPEPAREPVAEPTRQPHQQAHSGQSESAGTSTSEPQPEPVPSVVAPQPPGSAASENAQRKLKKTGYWEPPEFGERMRAAFLATSAAEGHESLSAFICAVLEREVERLEEKYNGGERYRKGTRGVRRGRPVGS